MARMSAAQPDNGAGAGCQASTQLDPVVLKARSAEEPPGSLGSSGPFLGALLGAEEPLIDKPVCPDIIILTTF